MGVLSLASLPEESIRTLGPPARASFVHPIYATGHIASEKAEMASSIVFNQINYSNLVG